MLNDDTDRIYLADSKGLIQCLHEIGLTKPVSHGEARRRAAEEAAKSSAAQKTPEKTGEEKPAPKKETAAEKIKAGDETEKPAPKDTNKSKTDKDPFAE
jgi:hypothetical protein